MDEPQFYYTTEKQHTWSSGPVYHYWRPNTWEPIESLEEARELALSQRAGTPGYEDYVKTSYGVTYRFVEEG